MAALTIGRGLGGISLGLPVLSRGEGGGNVVAASIALFILWISLENK